ncbi:MAG: pepsin-like aspartic protease [Pseudomonadota bacterium]|nr:pepsin-like aspartic protease [Pseudomonadota bacterium]
MAHSIRLALTNTLADGGYCVRAHVGTHQHAVHLILDTGSSTLAVNHTCYRLESDNHADFTYYTQSINYGVGSWHGPVIKTQVSLGMFGHSVTLPDAYTAIADTGKFECFKHADGILGLAYRPLNHAHYLFEVGEAQTPKKDVYQYIMSGANDNPAYKQTKAVTLPSYFTSLEEQGVVSDKFAFWLHRSSIYYDNGSCRTKALAHWQNHGLFVMGEPVMHRDLYCEPMQSAKVLHDKFYNVNLLSVKVGEKDVHSAPVLAEKDVTRWCSNAIVDTGATVIGLPVSLYNKVVESLEKYISDLSSILEPFSAFSSQEKGIPLTSLTLSNWPTIQFFLEDENGEDMVLALPPEAYWQIHAPEFNSASFKIFPLKHWPNQSILGLPLISQYYTIFDRSKGNVGDRRSDKKESHEIENDKKANGVITFAKKVTLASTIDTVKSAFSHHSNK